MSDAVIAALITGGVSLLGTALTVVLTSRRQAQEMDRKLAVMQAEMESMKEDIHTHNGYARMFYENIPAIKQHMKDVDRRLEFFERRSQ